MLVFYWCKQWLFLKSTKINRDLHLISMETIILTQHCIVFHKSLVWDPKRNLQTSSVFNCKYWLDTFSVSSEQDFASQFCPNEYLWQRLDFIVLTGLPRLYTVFLRSLIVLSVGTYLIQNRIALNAVRVENVVDKDI